VEDKIKFSDPGQPHHRLWYDPCVPSLWQKQRSSLWGPVAVSVLAHVVFAPLLPAFIAPEEGIAAQPKKLLVKLLNPRTSPPVSDANGQLVDVVDSRNFENKPPAGTDFLSDRNRQVHRQMQARLTGPADPRTAPSDPKQNPRGEGRLNLALPESVLEEFSQPKRHQTASLGPSNYLPEIEFGDETLLNTREFTYASYFIRMKRQIEANWSPRSWVTEDSARKTQWTTVVRMTLRRDGYLEKLTLVQSSGNPALDREAMEAIRKGAPFLNPPEALVSADGRITKVPDMHFIVTNRMFL